MIPRLSDITRLLMNPPLKPELKTTSGVLNPPFGATRLSKIIAQLWLDFESVICTNLVPYSEIQKYISLFLGVVKLICALLSTNIYEVNVQLKNLQTIDMLLVGFQISHIKFYHVYCNNRSSIMSFIFNIGSILQILLEQFSTCPSWTMHHFSVHLESSTNTWFHCRWK